MVSGRAGVARLFLLVVDGGLGRLEQLANEQARVLDEEHDRQVSGEALDPLGVRLLVPDLRHLKPEEHKPVPGPQYRSCGE